jgi:hypothetical protein
MTPEEFVEAIRRDVFHSAVEGTLSQLEKPSGRRPRAPQLEASAWYLKLSKADRAQVRRVAAAAAHSAVFGFFAVLDGVRTVTKAGDFVLVLRRHDQEWTLNGNVILHDIFNSDLVMLDNMA